MKRLHVFIIKSFVGPFFVTLIISLFVLLMQFLWVYLDELVGKGLEINVIFEFVIYAMALLMTNALPLAILLASIMTFGDLGENNELLAMKAAGISLYRIMKPVVVMSIFLSIGAFYFSNSVIPEAYKKLYALMTSIRELRPEIAIKEGMFSNDIDGFSIKVGEKARNGEMLYDIMIYDHTEEEKGNTNVTVADSGTMKITKDKKYMILNLYSGQRYNELAEDRRGETNTYPSRTDKFEKQTIYTGLEGMELERKDESLFRNQHKALKNDQVIVFRDSIKQEVERMRVQYAVSLNYMQPVNNSLSMMMRNDTAEMPEIKDIKMLHYYDVDSLLANMNHLNKVEVIQRALSDARNNVRALQISEEGLMTQIRSMNRFGIEWHKKYTFALACMIFLFVGAPLGAIIRKGGLGMPLVVSVFLFIFYWIMSTTGEKFARESFSTIWQGVWFSTLFFFPAGLFLTYKAANDSIVFDWSFFSRLFERIRFFKKKYKPDENIQE